MNNQGLNSDSLMTILPSVLDKDEGMHNLAKTVSLNIDTVKDSLKEAGIYYRLGELPEELLDVLAEDLGVFWYDYNHLLETKRRVIESCFDVHKHLGTKGAMLKAVCSVWPNSGIEEWFQYGGDPYYFRVMVEANNGDGEPIRFTEIDKTVQIYKNARSWLEDDSVVLRITCNVVIQTRQGAKKFHSVACGTMPRVSTHGKVGASQIVVGTETEPSVYHAIHAGESETGVLPHSFTHGDISGGGLHVGASLGVSTYNSTPCGTPLGALM